MIFRKESGGLILNEAEHVKRISQYLSADTKYVLQGLTIKEMLWYGEGFGSAESNSGKTKARIS